MPAVHSGCVPHFGWWRPFAHFLARDYRVATMSWSGMGRSDWRDKYTSDQLLREAGRVGETAGLFDAGAEPVMVAHSFGGFLAIRAAVSWADRLQGVVFVDSRLRPRRVWGDDAAPALPSNIYRTRANAIRRFRLQPPQPETNQFYLDMLAEEALVEVEGGWTWRSDPAMRNKIELGGDIIALIGQARCELAFIRGEKSTSVTDEIWATRSCLQTYPVIPAHRVRVRRKTLATAGPGLGSSAGVSRRCWSLKGDGGPGRI